jgi:hypothetical protein
MEILLLRAEEKRILEKINDMLKDTNEFSHKNALMYGIVFSSTKYYVIVGILREKGLINFRAGVPYIDVDKWNEFLTAYNQGKTGLFFRKPLVDVKKTPIGVNK